MSLSCFLLTVAAAAAPTPDPVVVPNGLGHVPVAPTAWNASVRAAAQASYLPTPFEYTYIDVLYQSIDDTGAPTRDGFAFRGSFDVTDNIRLLAGIGQATANTPAGENRVNDYSLGFGMHGDYTDWLDIVGDFEWTRREFRGVVDGRHKGWLASLGVRALPVYWFEFDASVLFQNSAENDIGGRLGIVWHWHDYLGFRGAAMRIGDESRFTAGVRFSR